MFAAQEISKGTVVGRVTHHRLQRRGEEQAHHQDYIGSLYVVRCSFYIPLTHHLPKPPLLTFPTMPPPLQTHPTLTHHPSYWPSPTSPSTLTHALALGLGPVFNHSLHTQNIGWTRDIPTTTITYVALRDIRAGEELCISYGSSSRLWFEDTEAREWESMMENWPWREGEREDEVHDRGETLGELELSGLSGVVVDLEE